MTDQEERVMSLFGSVFGELPPSIPPEYLKALRCAANAWLKEHKSHPQAALVKAALVSTNPKS